MDEKTIERHLRREVKKLGGIAYKFVSPGNAGVPDRIILLPGGTVKFIELKKPGGKTSPIQDLQIGKMRKLKADVRIIDSLEGVDSLIGEMKCDIQTP